MVAVPEHISVDEIRARASAHFVRNSQVVKPVVPRPDPLSVREIERRSWGWETERLNYSDRFPRGGL